MSDPQKGYISGRATCDKCAYGWVAVFPVGCTVLKCPVCGHMTPAKVGPVEEPPFCAVCGWRHPEGTEHVKMRDTSQEPDQADYWKDEK